MFRAILGRDRTGWPLWRRDATARLTEADAIRQSGLFDAVWYLERNPDAAGFADPVAHYVAVGARDQRPPHPLFDLAWYRAAAAHIDASGLTPLGHFILHGEAAGLSPNPLFDPAWYARQDGTLTGRQEGLFRHFLHEGARRGRSPHPAFDPGHYAAACPDLGDANPLTHFIGAGAGRLISPNPFFDLRWYVGRYDDVATSGLNPMVHFLQIGAEQGRRPHPHVDLAAYRADHPEAPADPAGAYLHLLAHQVPATFFAARPRQDWRRRHDDLVRLGLFDPAVYLELNEDLAKGTTDPDEHFARVGLHEGRPFTNAAMVARRLAVSAADLAIASNAHLVRADQAHASQDTDTAARWARDRAPCIAVFCHSAGNFYMQEIADLLADGLRAHGVQVACRNERAAQDEAFDLRIFVAPHEFFYLGQGMAWQDVVEAPNTVLYNVEQLQTPWFCRAFKLLLTAPLLLDINFQSAEILRQLGCNAVHFMPGHLPTSPFALPCEDVSDIALVQGYGFARQRFDWTRQDVLADRPIDILFVGAHTPRRDKAIDALLELADDYRFLCVYKQTSAPLTARNQRASSGRINCALAQRAKIVLNVYRDWLGYFDWSRMVQQGFWQGACVVSDPGLPNPIYQPGVHFQEESVRHLGELIRWLLGTPDGRAALDTTRRAGFARAQTLGSMQVALAPVLDAFRQVLER